MSNIFSFKNSDSGFINCNINNYISITNAFFKAYSLTAYVVNGIDNNNIDMNYVEVNSFFSSQ